jgi:hypothetical protein
MKKFIPTDYELLNMIPKIGHSGFIVYTILKRYMNNKTKKCFPSQDKISELTGYKKRQIVSAIKNLQKCNMVSVQKRRRMPNLYYLTNKAEWMKVEHREENKEPLAHKFILPDVYYEERINEMFAKELLPEKVFCVKVDFKINEMEIHEMPFYCPNCFLVMPGVGIKEMDCPWCQEKVTTKELVN